MITTKDAVLLARYASQITRDTIVGLALNDAGDHHDAQRAALVNRWDYWRQQGGLSELVATELIAAIQVQDQLQGPYYVALVYDLRTAELPRFEERLAEWLKDHQLRQDRPRRWATLLASGSLKSATRFVRKSRTGTFSKDVRYIRVPLRRDRAHL